MYNFLKGKGTVTPAVKRKIIEVELIEEYHWLPQEIKQIPYKDLQALYLIKGQKQENQHQQQALQQQVAQSKARGSSRRR